MAVLDPGLGQDQLPPLLDLIRSAPIKARLLREAHRALRQADAWAALTHLLVLVTEVDGHQVIDGLAASRRGRDGRHRSHARLRQNDFSAEAIDAIARLDLDGAVPSFPGDSEADPDAPSVKAAVVEPAKL